jgi:hypothetical protein
VEIIIDYMKMQMDQSVERYNTCIDILNHYSELLNHEHKLAFLEELEEKLPITFKNVSATRIHVKPLINFLNKYFLFCDEDEGVQVDSQSRTIGGCRYRVTVLYNIPNKKEV